MINFQEFGIDVTGKSGVEVKTTCPQCSHTRKKKTDKCLNVNLQTGLFHCWHCEFNGKAKDDSMRYTKPSKTYIKPKYAPVSLAKSVVDWFGNRGISEHVLERNKIGSCKTWMPQTESEVNCIAFPYYSGDEVINIKYRDSAKHFKMESGAERILYGFNDISEKTYIVEGEIDKLSMEQAGFIHCVSVPDGAPSPNTKNFTNKFDYLNTPELEKVKEWVIAVDNDLAGNCLKDELIRRFGAEKCLVVTWPDGCKDANDVLIQYGEVVLASTIEKAIRVPIEGVYGALELASDLFNLYENGMPKGLSTGWDEIDQYFTVVAGQMTIVTGIPGHGKSEWIDALLVNMAHLHGWKSGLYSPENQPTINHVCKLIEKYTGKPFNKGTTERISMQELTDAMDWVDKRFKWIMPKTPNLDEILCKASSLVSREGIRILVIDPWNEIEHDRPVGMNETDYVSVSLSKLRNWARKHEVALFVIAHPKMLTKDKDGIYPKPNPYDISGSAHWRNKADNCITVWYDQTIETSMVEIHIQKVRFKIVGKIGLAELRYDRITGIYHDKFKIKPSPQLDRKKLAGGENEYI